MNARTTEQIKALQIALTAAKEMQEHKMQISGLRYFISCFGKETAIALAVYWQKLNNCSGYPMDLSDIQATIELMLEES